jgi:hypothetical protein
MILHVATTDSAEKIISVYEKLVFKVKPEGTGVQVYQVVKPPTPSQWIVSAKLLYQVPVGSTSDTTIGTTGYLKINSQSGHYFPTHIAYSITPPDSDRTSTASVTWSFTHTGGRVINDLGGLSLALPNKGTANNGLILFKSRDVASQVIPIDSENVFGGGEWKFQMGFTDSIYGIDGGIQRLSSDISYTYLRRAPILSAAYLPTQQPGDTNGWLFGTPRYGPAPEKWTHC